MPPPAGRSETALAAMGASPHNRAMPVSAAYRPDPRFAALGPEFADSVAPAVFPMAAIRHRNQRAAASVGLDTFTESEWRAHFARFEPLPGNQATPLAMRYHGHQFRTYNPDLGDGRGFLFAQMREAGGGRLLDLGTKGSGRTPWSRGGDGRLTLKGGVREVLATAMLEALGVPTSRSLSLIETGEALQRGDEPSPTRSAVLTRLSWSHIRFGTFQRLAALDRADLIGVLVDHVVENYYPHLAEAPDKAAALLTVVVGRCAHLTARWMAAGFVHGVLNTDNMNITGESFDYGPYRFLPHNDPNFVAAYFDQTGLYAFGRQPEAVLWNLQQLAGALTVVSGTEPLAEALNGFSAAYRDALRAAMLDRLGLQSQSAPSGSPAPISPGPSPRNCSMTRSKRSGRRSPKAMTGGPSTPSSPPSSGREWPGDWARTACGSWPRHEPRLSLFFSEIAMTRTRRQFAFTLSAATAVAGLFGAARALAQDDDLPPNVFIS